MNITNKSKKFKAMGTLFQVLTILNYVGLGILVVFSTLGFVVGPLGKAVAEHVPEDTEAIAIFSETGQMMVKTLPTILATITSMVLFILIFRKARSIFRSIQNEETPFTRENAERIRYISLTMIVAAILPGIVQVITGLIVRAMDWDSVFSVVSLVIGLVLLCLSEVFNYGVRLQEESDNTI